MHACITVKTMTNVEENIYKATIPAFEYCTYVNYTIIAEDDVGNIISTTETLGYDYQYHIFTEFPSFIILPVLMTFTFVVVLLSKKKV